MRVKFTHDFQGKITGDGRFFMRDTEADFEQDLALELIALHHAVAVEPPSPTAISDPEEEHDAPVERRQRGGRKL